MLVAALVAIWIAPGPARAQEEQGKEAQSTADQPKLKDDKHRTRRSFTVDKWAFEKLNSAQEALSTGKYDEALKLMDDMQRRRGLNDHEKALMWQTLAYIYSGKDQPKKAIEALEKCLAQDALPDGAQLTTQFNLGQMYLVVEEYEKAVKTLVDWLNKVENPTPQAHYMVAMAYAQTEKYRKGLEHAKQAVYGGAKPQEPWLQLLLSLHYQVKETREMAKVLEMLVQRFPKKQYWTQLAAVYGEIGEEKRSLAALELAYEAGYLTTKSELSNLAQLYSYHDVPLKAAAVLEKGLKAEILDRELKTVELLANSYLRAREYEKAIAPLSEAAKLSEKGDLYVQLAQVYVEREDWKQAAAALKSAIDKGKLSDPANVFLLAGIVNYNLKRRDVARQAFEQARGFDKSAKVAKQWLDLMRNEAKIQ